MSLQSILPLRALGFIGKLLIAMALSSGVHELLYQIPDLSWIWEALLILLIFANFKNLPFAWHIRILNAFRFVLSIQRSKLSPTPAQLFQPIITASHSPLTEIDFNLHKSNSTYFSDLDIARSHLICTLFSSGIEKARYNKSKGIIGGGNDTFGVKVGAVSCSFKREVRPYQKYEMWTRVLSWDRKWLYLVTHFVHNDSVRPKTYTLYPLQNNGRKGNTGKPLNDKDDAIFASALSQCVFKKGRLTIPPEVMLQASGLLPPKPMPRDMTPLMAECMTPGTRELNSQLPNAPFQAAETLEAVGEVMREAASKLHLHNAKAPVDEKPAETPKSAAQQKRDDDVTWEKIEAERRKGMELAILLAGLDRLKQEFTADAEALGRHNDLL